MATKIHPLETFVTDYCNVVTPHQCIHLTLFVSCVSSMMGVKVAMGTQEVFFPEGRKDRPAW